MSPQDSIDALAVCDVLMPTLRIRLAFDGRCTSLQFDVQPRNSLRHIGTLFDRHSGDLRRACRLILVMRILAYHSRILAS